MSQAENAADMAEMIARLGLVDEFVVKELLYELEDKKLPAEVLTKLMERKGLLTPFQSAKLLKGDTDGYLLGGFRLLYRIAAGTFGKVYRGDDPKTGQIVAVKVLRKKWLDNENSKHRIAQFEREGRLGLTLQHPNIVQILAVSKDQSTDSYFIVMEFVEGGNLRDILTIRKKVALADALRIMDECVAGLAYAYSKGLTHRDIKPSNILIGFDGVAKLVDFGLAEEHAPVGPAGGAMPNAFLVGGKKAKDAKNKAEEPAERTLDYAGLEKNTNVKSGDIRSDIYFLGHALFEMIAGEPLMERTKNERQAKERRRFEMVEANLSKVAHEIGLPPSVKGLIEKAVALEPYRRFQTPDQFLAAIRAVREEFPVMDKNVETEHEAEPDRAPGPRSLFVVEPYEKLRAVFEEKLAPLGFEVTVTADPAEALRQYKEKPYHGLLVDGGVAGNDGIGAFADVLRAAKQANHQLAGVLILNEGQRASGVMVSPDPRASVLIRPVTMKQLATKLQEVIPE
jgi:serine/threonine protein kinase